MDSTVFNVNDTKDKNFCKDDTDLREEDNDLCEVNIVPEMTNEISSGISDFDE